jgi:hypothetical protein
MVLVFAHSGQYMRLSGGLNSPICHLYNWFTCLYFFLEWQSRFLS